MIPSLIDATLLLYVLGGAALVAGVLYLVKMKRRPLEVPYLRLWQEAIAPTQKSALMRVMRRIVSFLLFMAIAAAALLTLADPAKIDVEGVLGLKQQEEPPRRVLVIIDTSPSMLASDVPGGRLTKAKERAQAIVDGMGPNDRIMLARLEGKVLPLTAFVADDELLSAQIESLSIGVEASSPTAVASFLGTLEGDAPAEVVVISDFSWLGDGTLPDGVEGITIGSQGANIAVIRFNVRPHLEDPLSYDIFYELRNYEDTDEKVNVSFTSSEGGDDDWAMFHSENVTVPAGQVYVGRVKGLKFAGSRLQVFAEPTGEDVFPLDNRAYAVLAERHQLEVLLITEGNLYLYAALLLRENVDLEVVTPEEVTSLDGFDAVFVDGDPLALPATGNFVLFGTGGEHDPFQEKKILEDPDITWIAKKHPAMKGIKLVDVNVKSVSVPTLGDHDAPLAKAMTGEPVIVSHDDDQKKILSIRFDASESDFPLRYGFPLLVVNALNWFFPEQTQFLPTLASGTHHTITLAKAAPGDEVKVTDPDGATVGMVYGQDGLSLSMPSPGFYRFEWGDHVMERAASFIDAAESSVAPPKEPVPAYTIQDRRVPEGGPFDNPAPWLVFALVALGLMVIEWLTYHRRVTV